jgi:DNA repair protein RadC
VSGPLGGFFAAKINSIPRAFGGDADSNGANEILNIRVISIGLIDHSLVHLREVFADALSDGASAIIVAHNHPRSLFASITLDLTLNSDCM